MSLPTAPVVPSNAVVVFPDATGARQSSSVREIFSANMKQMYAKHGTKLVWWLLLCLAVMLATLLGTDGASFVPLLFIVGFFALPVVVVMWLQHRKAESAFWEGYGAARGLSESGAGFGYVTPLMQRGDEQEIARLLTGRIGACTEAQIAHFTYTEVTHTDDGEQRTDHNFTLIGMRLPAPVAQRYRGVYCRTRGIISLDQLIGKFTTQRSVELESVEFHKRLSLAVDDDQDDIALFELFNPTFIDAIATCAAKPQWEQVGPDLILYWDKHLSSSIELDAACEAAVLIHNRYLEEHT